MAHASRVKWTVLPRGVVRGTTPPVLKLAIFVTPEVVAASAADVGTRVPLAETPFQRWPERLRSLELRFHVDAPLPFAVVVPQNTGSIDIWNQLLGQTTAQLLPPPTAVAAAEAPPRVFPAGDTFSTLRQLHQTSASRVFVPIGPVPAAAQPATPLRPFAPTAAHVRDTFGRLVSPAVGPAAAAVPDEPMRRTIAQAVGFYSREAAIPAPVGAAAAAPTPAAADNADFHQWVARLAYHPWLLAQLGLLLDVEIPWRFPWPTGIPRDVWITGVAPFDTPIVKTRCRLLPDQGIFDAAFEQPALHPGGCLPLSGPEYSVVPVDVDGAAVKADSFSREIARFADAEHAVPPSLRSAGLSVVKARRSADLDAAKARAAQLKSQLATSGQVVLSAEHLIRGYRVDVRNRGQWRSLCERQIAHPWSRELIRDSGWTSLSVTRQGTREYLHESLFLWGGWSLVASRPGKAVGQDGQPVNGIDAPGGVKIRVTPAPGTLPSLRFGEEYQFRAIAVDLGGQPLVGQSHESPECMTAPGRYRRFDPVGSPLVIPRENLRESPGQSVTHLVIRSGDHPEHWRTAERHLAPPPIDPTLAEWHGLFDRNSAGPSGRAYADVLKAARRTPASTDVHFHDTDDEFEVRYVVDPLARGVTLFGLPHSDAPLPIDFGRDQRAFRIVLKEGRAAPRWEAGSRVLTVFLEPAQSATVQIASHIRAADLGLLGMWEWLQSLPGSPPAEVAANGTVWMLTPARELTLTHAVQRPLAEPTPKLVIAPRRPGDTFAVLTGTVALDVPSSGHLEVVGTWEETVDRPDAPGPQTLASQKASVYQAPISVDVASAVTLPATQSESRAQHPFGDTHARTVYYSAVATSRFTDQFRFPDSRAVSDGYFTRTTPAGAANGVGDVRVKLVVPSTARPDAPRVRCVVPLLGWREPVRSEERTRMSAQVQRQMRGSGIRVYLERLWYSSGDNERLAILLWPGAEAHLAAGANELPTELTPYVSQWGMDPIWMSRSLTSVLGLQHLPGRLSNLDDARHTVEELERPGQPYLATQAMQIAAYRPEYDKDRRLWFCDIEFDRVDTYRPFVRLALARFQPDSIVESNAAGDRLRDLHLSRVLLSDFAQLGNDRSASATYFRKERKLTVSLTGLTYSASAVGLERSTVRAIVERRTPHDVQGWIAEPNVVADLQPRSAGNDLTVWEGDLPLGNLKVKRGHHRVVFSEFDSLPIDESPNYRRLVYADALEL